MSAIAARGPVEDVAAPAPERCAACGGPLSPWRWAAPHEPGARRRYLLVRCASCGTAATAGDPDPELYETGVYAADPRRVGIARRTLRRLYERHKLALIGHRVPPPARLVEIGAGQGRLVAAARAAGYEASGIEPSRRGVEAAAARGVELQQATIETAELPAGGADAIVLWHVLEHLDDPRTGLERVRRWLAPAGAVLIGVPNLASLQARLGGSSWMHLDVPRHRHHFTPAGLRTLLERSGFAVEAEHHLLLEHNPLGMWQAWLDRVTATPAYAYNLVKRNAALNARDLVPTVLVAPLAPLAFALEVGAGLARRGGTIAVLARPG